MIFRFAAALAEGSFHNFNGGTEKETRRQAGEKTEEEG